MLLLNPWTLWKMLYPILIYIPLCFYLIKKDQQDTSNNNQDLHSTMLLLNQIWTRSKRLLRQNLHSTMLLLNRIFSTVVTWAILNLHSTMLLLNHFLIVNDTFIVFIYIPLCFYLIPSHFLPFILYVLPLQIVYPPLFV